MNKILLISYDPFDFEYEVNDLKGAIVLTKPCGEHQFRIGYCSSSKVLDRALMLLAWLLLHEGRRIFDAHFGFNGFLKMCFDFLVGKCTF